MKLKKTVKALLFPHIAILIALLPVATAFLVYAMVALGTESPIAIVSYVLASYTLTVWCVRIPRMISGFKAFKSENKYAKRWLEDERLRVNVSLFSAFIFNTAYAAFHVGLGAYHSTFWFYSLGIYYAVLAFTRLFLVRHTLKFKPGENMRLELIKYCACGWIFLILNLALTLIIFFMVYWNRTFEHNEITTITMAAYTFTSLTVAIVNMVKYRKFGSPIYSASKALGLSAACVSVLTLESAMLTAFGDPGTTPTMRKMLLALSGGAVSAVIITMAVYMIVQSTKKFKLLRKV